VRLDPDGRIVLEGDDVQVLAAGLPVVARELWRRDRVQDARVERLAYQAALLSGRLGATTVASVTDISTAPSLRRWVPCVDCGEETDRPRRGRCDRCRKRVARAGDRRGLAAS